MLNARHLARAALAATLALSVAALSGCPDDPYDADTWIDKLDDKQELERALTELARLKDPDSIGPLGEAWKDNNRPVRILRMIIDIADQFNPEDERYTHVSSAAARLIDCSDSKYEAKSDVTDPKLREEIKTKRCEADKNRTYGPFADKGPYWEKALPFLHDAVKAFLEDDNARTIEGALAAVDALGRAKEFGVDSDVDIVINAAMADVTAPVATPDNPNPPDPRVVRIAALRALGKWSDDPRAADTLIKVLTAKVPDPTKDKGAMGELLIFAAAADALGYAQDEKAINPLIEAMFKVPVVYPFARRSLVAIGKGGIKPLMDVFQRKHKEVMALAKKEKFFAKCKGDKRVGGNVIKNAYLGGEPTCIAPKALETKSANILGDLQAKQAIPIMLKELEEPAEASGFHPVTKQPFTRQHQAIFIALRKMGANEDVAKALMAYAKNSSNEDDLAAMAVDTYSFVTRSTDELAYLEGLMLGKTDRTGKPDKDADETETIARAASIAYSRLANSKSHMDPFKDQIKKHKKAADSYEKQFEAANKKYEKEKEPYEKLKKDYEDNVVRPEIAAWEKANAALKKSDEKKYKAARAKKPWFETIKKNKAKAKKRADYNKAKKEFEELEFKKNNAENKMNESRGLQRAAEQNLARILVGINCKGDPKCLISFATKSPDDVAKELDKDIVGAAKWDPDSKKLLWVAANERALLELSKLGKKAQPALDEMFKLLPETERIIREGVLLALPHVVDLPCAKCVATLDQVIKDQESQTTLNALTADARVWRNYYRWAGKK